MRPWKSLAGLRKMIGQAICFRFTSSPIVEDLRRWGGRYGVSRMLLSSPGSAVVAVVEASSRGVVRAADWFAQARPLGRVPVVINKVPAVFDFDEIIGQNVTVSMDQKGGGKRYWNGFISRFVQGVSTSARFAQYRATMVPWLWFLTRKADCRIFQQMTIPDIIKEPSGLPDDMRSYGTRAQLKATILKSGGDDSFGPHDHGHFHNY